MKLICTLFQIALLIFVQVIFVPAALAETNGTDPTDTVVVSSVSSVKSSALPHSAMAIVTTIKSEFVGILVSLASLLLFGRAILLLAGQPQVKRRVTEIPAEVPPLRPSITRATKF